MLAHFSFALAVLVCGLLFAILEIQIEGSNGWASGLPTWRVDNRLTRLLLGGRELTGYHAYFHALMLALLHLPYALFIVAPTWAIELRLFAFLTLFWIVEDFLWFVLNPSFGIRRFKAGDVWWHERSWWGVMPREYWIFTPVGVALYLLSVQLGCC